MTSFKKLSCIAKRVKLKAIYNNVGLFFLISLLSTQANMMDKLISKFVDELKQRPSWCEDQVDNFISVPHEEDDGK